MKSLNGKGKKMPWEISKEDKKGYTHASQSGIYSNARWRKLRAYILDKEPLCRRHLEKFGKYVPATMVDHIIPADDEPSLFYDEENLQSLCQPCHRIKTNQDRGRSSAKNLAKGQRLMDDLEAD